MKRIIPALIVIAVCTSAYLSWRGFSARDASFKARTDATEQTKSSAVTPSPPPAPAVSANANSHPGAPSDGSSPSGNVAANAPDRRAWDSQYLANFQQIGTSSPVRFELTGGLMASGTLRYVERRDGQVIYISGDLTEPETGRFFFQKQTLPGKQGDFAGVVEFPASQTAYRIEPSGPGGSSELVKRRLDEVICLAMPAVDAERLAADGAEEIPPLDPQDVTGYVPGYNDGIISLQSLPGVVGVLYIDFRGGYTPTWGGITYDKPNVSNAQIKDVWKRVAEDYMPFNINVTTDIHAYEAAPENSRQRCICTPTTTAAPGAGGVAYMNDWNATGDRPCWSFYSSGKSAAEVVSHEVGHTLQLGHDGRTTPSEGYFGGHGSGAVGWAPIMGVGYYQPVAQWSKGEYASANNTQDDLAIIVANNNSVDYRTDDTGATLATARYLELYPSYGAFAEGVIETTADTDAFRFTTSGGQMSLTASAVGDWADLAIMATVCNEVGTIIASNNPQTTLGVALTTNLSAGTYTFRVTGTGRNNPLTNGFSSYASLGYYSVTGSVAGAVLPTRLSVAENSTNGTIVGTVTSTNLGVDPLVYVITSGNLSNAFALDDNGVLTVANSAALNYEALAAKTQFTVQYEVFVNITDTAHPELTELNRRVVVQILDVNEAPIGVGFTNTVLTGTQPGTYIGTVKSMDPDQYAIANYTLATGISNSLFTIGLLDGGITVASNITTAMTGTYDLIVQIRDTATNGTTALASVRVIVLTNSTPFTPGSISYALYDGIGSGSTVADLTNNARFPRDPTAEKQMPTFAGDTDRADSYGSVIRGYLIPPTSGSYTFWIASDDASDLLMSTTTNPATMTRIAYVTSYTSPQQWSTYSSQKSSVRALTAGQAYYVEARQKEGGGGDHVAVAWKGPATANLTNVISGLYLAPYRLNYVPHVTGFTTSVRRGVLPGTRLGRVVVTDVNASDTYTIAILSGNTESLFDIDSAGWIVVSNATALAATATPSFTLSVRATDRGLPALSGTANVVLNIVAAGAITATQIQREMFNAIGSGTAVTDLTTNAKYPAKPDALAALADFASPANVADNYGSRIRGFVIPPTNGDYRFFISSDDSSQLKFSRTTNAASAGVIAYVTGYTSQNVWTQAVGQMSAIQAGLVGGQRYYLEALQKEGGGGDHVEVAWTGPGIVSTDGLSATNIIAAAFMAPVDINAAPQLTNHAFNLFSNAPNGTVLGTINASDSPLDTLTFQILSGNTANTLAVEPTTGVLRLADNSAVASGAVNSLSLSVMVQDSGYGGLYPLRAATGTVSVTIQRFPLTPQNLVATALGTNLVSVSWTPVTNSSGFVLARSGTSITTLSGTNYLDFSVGAGLDYCYSVAATNVMGASPWSETNCVTTPTTGGALVWDANRTTTGPQDGSGNWGGTALTWWNGSNNIAWTKVGLAVIAGATTTNCVITMTNAVSVNGIVFNATSGGSYTLAASGGSLSLSSNSLFTANGGATINAPLTGVSLIKQGPGTLTLNGVNTSTEGATINAGTLKASGTSGSFGSGPVTVAAGAMGEWNTASANRVITAVNAFAGDGLFLKSGANYLQLQGGASSTFNGTVRVAGGLLILDTASGFDDGSPNLDLPGGDLVLGTAFDDGTATFGNLSGGGQVRVDWGTATATRTVIFNQTSNTTHAGTLGFSAGLPRVLDVVKAGEGTLTLSGTSTSLGRLTVSNGTLVVNGLLGTNTLSVQTNATLAGIGIVPGTVVINGSVAPGPGVGALSTGDEIWAGGGSYLCEIQATNSDGSDQLAISGALDLQAVPVVPFTIKLLSLTSSNSPGPLEGFDNTAGYSWPIAVVGGGFANFDTNSLALDLTGFSNELSGGSFSLVALSNALILTYNAYVAPIVVPQFTGISVGENQSMLLSGLGAPGQNCVLLAATNLVPPVVWLPLTTNAADASGVISFTDPSATNEVQRYYRMLTP